MLAAVKTAARIESHLSARAAIACSAQPVLAVCGMAGLPCDKLAHFPARGYWEAREIWRKNRGVVSPVLASKLSPIAA
jgi:hypothetical protein